MVKKINPGTDEDVINLDFSDLKPRSGGKAAHVPEGDYLLEAVSLKNVEIKGGRNAGGRQVACQFRIVGTPNSPEARKGMGDTVYQNAQIGEKSLWFLRNMINDLTGQDVTGKAMAIPLSKMAGKRVGATLQDGNPYTPAATADNPDPEETIRSEIKYTFPAERFIGFEGGGTTAAADEDEEEPEAAPVKKAAANGKASAKKAAEAVATTDEDDEAELEIEALEDLNV